MTTRSVTPAHLLKTVLLRGTCFCRLGIQPGLSIWQTCVLLLMYLFFSSIRTARNSVTSIGLFIGGTTAAQVSSSKVQIALSWLGFKVHFEFSLKSPPFSTSGVNLVIKILFKSPENNFSLHKHCNLFRFWLIYLCLRRV